MVAQLIGFLGVPVAVICAPGPDTALTVRNALAGGAVAACGPPPVWPSARPSGPLPRASASRG
jgi:hypothetical protein